MTVARLLAIHLAIYWTDRHRTGPNETGDCTDVACANVSRPHQTSVCRAIRIRRLGVRIPPSALNVLAGNRPFRSLFGDIGG